MTDAPHNLDYAPPPPLPHRKSFRRYIFLFSLIAIALSAFLWGPAAWHRIQLLYWQRQCLNYTAAAGQVVLDISPDKSWQPNIAVTPPAWTQHYSTSSGLAVVFLHSRIRPSGEERLVVVEAFIHQMPWITTLRLEPRVLGIYSPFRDPYDIVQVSRPIELAGKHLPSRPPHPPVDRIRVFAGQPDPADPSHFTFDYEVDGKRSTVDGYLTNNDWVTLEVRPPSP